MSAFLHIRMQFVKDFITGRNKEVLSFANFSFCSRLAPPFERMLPKSQGNDPVLRGEIGGGLEGNPRQSRIFPIASGGLMAHVSLLLRRLMPPLDYSPILWPESG